jgi:hypothetical protein
VIDQTTQAILTVGMPTLAVLVGILVNNSRLSDLRAYIDSRLSAIEKLMDARFDAVDARFEAAHQELLRVEGVLDARLSHLEQRR